MESWKWMVIAVAVAAGGWMLFGTGTPGGTPWDDPLEINLNQPRFVLSSIDNLASAMLTVILVL